MKKLALLLPLLALAAAPARSDDPATRSQAVETNHADATFADSPLASALANGDWLPLVVESVSIDTTAPRELRKNWVVSFASGIKARIHSPVKTFGVSADELSGKRFNVRFADCAAATNALHGTVYAGELEVHPSQNPEIPATNAPAAGVHPPLWATNSILPGLNLTIMRLGKGVDFGFEVTKEAFSANPSPHEMVQFCIANCKNEDSSIPVPGMHLYPTSIGDSSPVFEFLIGEDQLDGWELSYSWNDLVPIPGDTTGNRFHTGPGGFLDKRFLLSDLFNSVTNWIQDVPAADATPAASESRAESAETAGPEPHAESAETAEP